MQKLIKKQNFNIQKQRINLTFTLFVLGIIISTAINAAPIFQNSFEGEQIQAIQFIQPETNQVVDQDNVTTRVRVVNNGRLQSVTINGTNAQIISQTEQYAQYSAVVPLNLGSNNLIAIATYSDQSISAQIQTSYIPLPEITITSPTDWQTFGAIPGAGGSLNQSGIVQRPVTITGTLNSSSPSSLIIDVQINQQQADFDSSSFTFADFFLHEGSNLIDVTATDEYNRQTSTQITVYVDQSAPFLSVDGLDNTITSANQIEITGTVNDAISADFNAPMVSVVIQNPATGDSIQAQVEAINYLALPIKLAVGNNPILITATDGFGNSRDLIANAVRIAVGTNRITRFTGNNQSAPANTQLPQPLIINAMDKAGLPLQNLPIYFDVIKGTATISTQQNTPDTNDGVNPARNLIINSNNSGQAQVWLTLGAQAGLAGTIIRAYNPTLAEDVYFTATTLTGDPTQVQIEGTSGTQYAQTNSQPVEALTVIVSDVNNNPIANTNVIFSIDTGDAYFKATSAIDGQLQTDQTIQTITDNKGQASVRPYIGTSPSTIKIKAQTQLADNTLIGNAKFHIIALQRKDGPTKLSGITMDHSGIPIAGIQFSIARTNLTALSDEQGYFQFPSQVPTGKIDLFVDGRDVQVTQAGETIQYPALHFETAIIQGQANQLPHPVYLPPVHIQNTQTVGGNQDVILTLPNFDGFKMIVKANSATFPDGSTEGELVVNPVHNDRLPMVPPGTSGRFMATGWTIQPTGTRFDPPIEVHIPNTDGLKPGTVIPIVQWDHDMAFFVPMGLGTVSEDGSALVSNPDSGITKAGWGGVPPPIADNDAECENGMNKSTGQSCGTCDVTIKADNEENELWKLFDKGGTEVSFVAKLSTGCGKATVEWNFEGSLIEAPLITIYEYSDFGTYNVEVKIFCDNCHPSVSDKIKIEIFLPVVEIKKDEEMPFELIDRGAGVISYFERTNLIVEVQYPTDHPDAKEVIIDFTGTVKMLENENTNYYNDAVFNTFLPFDIAIMNGKGEKSLDSDSTVKNIGDAVPELAEIYLEAIDFDFVESESVLTIDVEQWVKNSGLSISENVGELNNSEMPDWLEKAVWTIVRNARAQSGIVAEVGQGVTSVKLLANNTQRICGEVPFLEENEIKIVSVCAGNLKLLRENSSKYLNKLVLHETRHTWQNHQLLSKPTTAMGEGPVNDSDKDGCPEIVPIGSEAELGDITPIQDGAGTTGGDNGPVIGQQTKECYDLFEFDGKGFGNDHF